MKTRAGVIVILIGLFVCTAAFGQKAQKQFKGRVIYASADLVELKRGKAEMKLYFSEGTQVLGLDGKAAERSLIEPCQYVSAMYETKDKKRYLVKIQLTKESDCKK